MSEDNLPADPLDHECEDPSRCPLHLLGIIKIRASRNEDETYLSAHDLSTFLQVWHEYQMGIVAVQLEEAGIPMSEQYKAAILNSREAARVICDFIHSMGHLDISDTLTDQMSILVSPETNKAPDTVPSEWTHEKESQ